MTESSAHPHIHPYKGPAGGYGSAKSVAGILIREEVPFEGADLVLNHHNKASGYMCVSCAWGKPGQPHPIGACENGIKAIAEEAQKKMRKLIRIFFHFRKYEGPKPSYSF